MPIDPSIIGGLKPFQVESPVNALAQMLQVQGAQQQNQLGQAKLDEYSRGVQRQNGLRDLISGLGGDASDDQRINAMKTGGYFDEADKLQTGMLARQKIGGEVAKDNATAAKTSAETLGLKLQHHKDQLGPVADPQSAALWVKAMYDDPDMAPIVKMSGKTLEQVVAAIPQDPAGFEKWKLQSSLGADKLVEYTNANANTIASNKTSILTTQMNNTVARAGQAQQERAALRADARASETLAQGKTPSGYRANSDGTLSFIPGGPADPAIEKNKPLTETQGKATGFAARMQDADKIIAKFDKTVSPAAVAAVGGVAPSWLPGGGMVDAAVNSAVGMRAPEAQLYQQAQENWLTANLRLESGAVIGDKEKENEAKKWFPQPGDTDERKTQKAVARKVAERSMAVQAGSGAKQINNIVGSGGQPANVIKVSSADDYAKVPSGANYIAPDGHTRRKP